MDLSGVRVAAGSRAPGTSLLEVFNLGEPAPRVAAVWIDAPGQVEADAAEEYLAHSTLGEARAAHGAVEIASMVTPGSASLDDRLAGRRFHGRAARCRRPAYPNWRDVLLRGGRPPAAPSRVARALGPWALEEENRPTSGASAPGSSGSPRERRSPWSFDSYDLGSRLPAPGGRALIERRVAPHPPHLAQR